MARSRVLRISVNLANILSLGNERFNSSMGGNLKKPLSMVEYSEILARRLQDRDLDLRLYFGEERKRRR